MLQYGRKSYPKGVLTLFSRLPLTPFLLLHGHRRPLSLTAQLFFTPPRASTTSLSYRSPLFYSSTGIDGLSRLPLNSFLLLHGHRQPRSITTHLFFTPPRASTASLAYRSTLLYSSTGTDNHSRLPLTPFLLLHGHRRPLSLTAQLFFTPPQASTTSLDYHSSLFYSSTGTDNLARLPLISFLLFHGHRQPRSITTHLFFTLPRASTTSLDYHSSLFYSSTGIDTFPRLLYLSHFRKFFRLFAGF